MVGSRPQGSGGEDVRFRPALVPTIFVAIGLLILLNLGAWQIRRNGETSARLERIESRFDGPALTDLSGKSAEELSWHRAELSGIFLNEPPMLVTARYEFGEVGFDVVQPMQVAGGPLILVNRGWIPRNDWEATLLTISTGDAPVQVEGLLLDVTEFEGDPEARAIPAEGALPERWPNDSYEAMARRFDGALPVVLIAGQPLEEGEQKQQGQVPVTGYRAKPNVSPHLEYAATWFLIAGTLLTIWIVAGFRRGSALAQR
jgi:surfeit locus 1 family protein